jgi:hypothetical protein
VGLPRPWARSGGRRGRSRWGAKEEEDPDGEEEEERDGGIRRRTSQGLHSPVGCAIRRTSTHGLHSPVGRAIGGVGPFFIGSGYGDGPCNKSNV